MKTLKDGWWNKFYEENIISLILERDNKKLNEDARFLKEVLGVDKTDNVLDQCCGLGNLSIGIADFCSSVTGIDITNKYIDIAKRNSKSNSYFFTADALEYSKEEYFDCGYNWYTSFGYSDNDEVNILMLERAYESLIFRGKFALEYFNVANIMANFKPIIRYSKDSKVLVKESELDFKSGMMITDWKSGNRSSRGQTRLYTPYDIIKLFKDVGFKNIELYGGSDYSEINIDSKRCIVVGEK